MASTPCAIRFRRLTAGWDPLQQGPQEAEFNAHSKVTHQPRVWWNRFSAFYGLTKKVLYFVLFLNLSAIAFA